MTGKRHREDGFSLLELLTALTIFAIIAVVAQQGMFSAMMSSQRIDERSAELADLQLAISLVTRDLQNIQPRPARAGAELSDSPLVLTEAGTRLVFSRSAPVDPAGRARGAFTRVGYAPDARPEGRPVRTEWLSVDHPAATPADRESILDPLITALRFETLAGGAWSSDWPSAGSAAILPEAISVTFQTDRWGAITRIVALK